MLHSLGLRAGSTSHLNDLEKGGGDARRPLPVNTGDPASQLRERHDASDFELRTQDKLEAADSA